MNASENIYRNEPAMLSKCNKWINHLLITQQNSASWTTKIVYNEMHANMLNFKQFAS